MVGFPAGVRAVYFGPSGIFAGVKPRTILNDTTTTIPTLSREIAERAAFIDCSAIDAPVSGGDIGARNATLSIMVGGTKEEVQTVIPPLELLGKTIVYHGEPGSGQHAKLCNQIVIASMMMSVCENLLFGYKAGLDLDRMLNSISGGAAACWTLTHLAPRILQRNFDPGFFVDYFVKDMGLVLKQSKRMNLTLPGLALAQGLYQSVVA
jgi:3-hydroxyisobutyrate dehydrogenase